MMAKPYEVLGCYQYQSGGLRSGVWVTHFSNSQLGEREIVSPRPLSNPQLTIHDLGWKLLASQYL